MSNGSIYWNAGPRSIRTRSRSHSTNPAWESFGKWRWHDVVTKVRAPDSLSSTISGIETAPFGPLSLTHTHSLEQMVRELPTNAVCERVERSLEHHFNRQWQSAVYGFPFIRSRELPSAFPVPETPRWSNFRRGNGTHRVRTELSGLERSTNARSAIGRRDIARSIDGPRRSSRFGCYR